MDFEFTQGGSACLRVYLHKKGFMSPSLTIMKRYNCEENVLTPAVVSFDITIGQISPTRALYMGQLYFAAHHAARLFDRLITDDPAASYDPAYIEHICSTPFLGLIDPGYPSRRATLDSD